MRFRVAVLSAVTGVVLVIAVGLALVMLRSPAGPGQAAQLAPPDALAYVSAAASGGQLAALEDLLGRFPRIDVSDGLEEAAGHLLDGRLGELGLSFEDDIAPWFGGEVAGFFAASEDPQAPSDGALLVATTDPEASLAAARKAFTASGYDGRDRTYREVAYTASEDGTGAYAVLEGYLVAGTEPGVRAAVDASRDGSLAASERFTTALSRLPSERLALYYADLPRLFETLEEAAEPSPSGMQGMSAFGLTEDAVIAAAVSVHDQQIILEQAADLPEDDQLGSAVSGIDSSRLVESVPADSWLAFEVPRLGETLTGFFGSLEQSLLAGVSDFLEEKVREELGLDLHEDVLGWMGNARLFVRGTAPLAAGGAVIVDSTDADATRRFVDRSIELAQQDGTRVRPVERGGLTGGSVQEFGMPAPVFLLGGDRLVMGYGEDATGEAISPSDTLADSPTFQAAGAALAGYGTALFIDVAAAVEFAENAMAIGGIPMDAYNSDVRPWLEPFDYLATGGRRDGSMVVQRLVIGLRDATGE